jgi:hypothetical protein
LLNSLKQFFKWLFKRGSNNISGLISFVFIFIAVLFFDYNLVNKNPLLLIPLLFILLVLNQVIESLLGKILGDKNKQIGFGYFVLAILLITGVSATLN